MKASVTPLAQFDSKGMFARKRVKGRNFYYEFGRLSKEMQDKLDGAIFFILTQLIVNKLYHLKGS
jgi:ParB family chromosome partitioning protein